MPQASQRWVFLSQIIIQWLALAIIVSLAGLGLVWWGAALLGWAPWLQLRIDLGAGTVFDAGIAAQSVLTLLLLGLCFFLPTNGRVMQLERSHREFNVSMWDVARAYQAVHGADRQGTFALRSEFDSVRDRLRYLRKHPDLGNLEPEILEMAAQMSHESRELAEIYSDEKVERAKCFLRQRQEEAQRFQERVQIAHSVCRDLRIWLDKVEVEEAIARSQLKRLKEDLRELLPALGLDLARKPMSGAEPLLPRIAAE
ncbi:DNA repair protein [uncultured Paracoccus sp.]|uniref:DNA repair protein n=1 Tax=uncultured Paracoccus sp. TaxID=189685 RepID=UPI0026252607|nr:DNA repair protein [uncultured Paracoccus sp.]